MKKIKMQKYDPTEVLDLTGRTEVKGKEFCENKKIKKVIIGPNLTSLEIWAFLKCENLEEIDFSNSIFKEIPYRCFSNCKSLKELDFSNTNIEILRDGSFSLCENLEEIDFFNSILTEIPSYCFWNCKSLKELDFSNTNIEIL